MLATRDAVDGLDARVDQHYAELKALRGKVNAMRRWEAEADEKAPESHQDAPGASIGRRAVVGAPRLPRGNY